MGNLLERVGGRVRRRRLERGLSVRALAQSAGLSPRFLAEVEAGRGNIALSRLDGLARALEIPIEALVAPSHTTGVRQAIDRLLDGREPEALQGVLAQLEVMLGVRRTRVIALLGVRGAGKSSVGPLLSARLELPFVELDERIAAAAGMGLGEIFALHGEAYYRRLEGRCLSELVASGGGCVVALPGGVVGHEETFALVRASCFSVWLRADPEDYWQRVVEQGDQRPMADRADAMAELRSLVASREPLYQQADAVVETSALGLVEVCERVVAAVVGAGLVPAGGQ